MSTIKSNSVMNRIKTVENVNNFNSNIKKIMAPYFAKQAKINREMQLIDDNINFRYSGEDLFNQCEYNSNNINELIMNGYSFSSEDDYIYNDYNKVKSIDIISNPKFTFDRGIESITFFDGIENLEIKIAFEDNVIIFFNEEKRKIVAELQVGLSVSLKDVVMFEDNLYLYVEYNNRFYLINTSLALKFAGTVPVEFTDIESFYCIPINYEDFGKIVSVDRDTIIFCDDQMMFRKVCLAKRYFFESNGAIFFTKDDNIHSNLELSTGEIVQSEHLFLYDIGSLFGLNDLADGDNKFINSERVLNKSDLFKFKFDDTTNGFINYFDFVNDKTNQPYKVDFSIGKFFKCFGNFFLENKEDGTYKILVSSFGEHRTIAAQNSNLRFQLLFKATTSANFKVLKDIKVSNQSGNFYFCNLKFVLNGVHEHDLEYEFEFDQINFPDIKINNKKFDLDIELSDNTDSVEERLQNNKFIVNRNRLKSNMSINYLDYLNGQLKTNPFVIQDEVLKLEEIPVLGTTLEDLFSSLPIESDSNYMINYKNVFDEQVTLGTSKREVELFSINRIKFTLNISRSDFV